MRKRYYFRVKEQGQCIRRIKGQGLMYENDSYRTYHFRAKTDIRICTVSKLAGRHTL